MCQYFCSGVKIGRNVSIEINKCQDIDVLSQVSVAVLRAVIIATEKAETYEGKGISSPFARCYDIFKGKGRSLLT